MARKKTTPRPKETESPALASDALHYVADIYINVGVLVALLLTTFTGWGLADPLISMAIALYILKAAFGLARESINILMDRRLPVEVDHKVAELTRTRLTTLRLKRLS